MKTRRSKPTVSPLIIPLLYCHINGLQRASSVEKPWPGGEKKRDGWAAPPVAWCGDGVVASPVCATGVSLLARGCLSGATPRGEPWTSAVTLPHGRSGLNARRMAVLETFRAPSLCRHVHRELWRSVVLDVTPIIAATACHQSNDVERYSRYIDDLRKSKAWTTNRATTTFTLVGHSADFTL